MALLFAASTIGTIAWCRSMADMGGMPMPGGWTMSMAWMVMPGQTWLQAGASFLGMWILMMVAMMLPSLVFMLDRYREAVGEGPRLRRLTALVGLGYFLVWTAVGAVVFPAGVALAELTMAHPVLARAVPGASAAVVLIAGALQFTAWKARHLACCRDAVDRGITARAAWRHGVRLGVLCNTCCAGFTAVLLVTDVMDLGVMAVVTAAITAERLAPAGERVARATGVVIVAVGVVLAARAVAG